MIESRIVGEPLCMYVRPILWFRSCPQASHTVVFGVHKCPGTSVHPWVCMCVCLHVCMYVYMHTHTCVRTHTCVTWVSIRVFVCLCVRVSVYQQNTLPVCNIASSAVVHSRGPRAVVHSHGPPRHESSGSRCQRLRLHNRRRGAPTVETPQGRLVARAALAGGAFLA